MKKAIRLREWLFSWQGQKDSSRRDTAKPRFDFDFATLLSHRGSDVPQAHHSLPLFSSPLINFATQKGYALRTLFVWQGQKDSNPRHPVLETGVLPTELYPYVIY